LDQRELFGLEHISYLNSSISLTFPAHIETIRMLNTHAEIRANIKRIGNEEFYTKFTEFTKAFLESEQNVTYLTGDCVNPTRTAYESLLKCKKYVDDP